MKVAIVMCRHSGGEWERASAHGRHSMVLVPMSSPGITVLRPLTVFGYDDAPHGHAEVDLRCVFPDEHLTRVACLWRCVLFMKDQHTTVLSILLSPLRVRI